MNSIPKIETFANILSEAKWLLNIFLISEDKFTEEQFNSEKKKYFENYCIFFNSWVLIDLIH